MVGVDLGLNTIFEVLGRIAEVALDVVLRVAAHAFQGSRHGPHQGFLLLRLIERPGGFEVVDVSLFIAATALATASPISRTSRCALMF